MTADRIVLTIPRDDGFEEVAQLVLGGVAARLDLTYEMLDDLGTAFASLLEPRGEEGDLTVELLLGGDLMTATIGPFHSKKLRAELEQHDGGVDLRRVLETVVDSFEAVERDGADWVELQKRLERAPTA